MQHLRHCIGRSNGEKKNIQIIIQVQKKSCFFVFGPTPVNTVKERIFLLCLFSNFIIDDTIAVFRSMFHEKSIVAPQLHVIFISGKHAKGSNSFSLCSAGVVSDPC